MATYTDNYSLTKPTFAEVADIRTINGNMDTIDDIMHASQVSLADAYDQTATYNTGDVVMYEFLMYKCKEDNVTGNWDATKWERTTAAEAGGEASDLLVKVPEVISTGDKACYVKRAIPTAGALAEGQKIVGATLAWNQLVDTGTTSVTIASGHKYIKYSGGTYTKGTSDGTAISVSSGDLFFDITQMFGSTIADSLTVEQFSSLFPDTSYAYDVGTLESVNVSAHKAAGKNLWDEDYTGISENITYKAINVGDGSFTCSTTCPLSGQAANIFFLAGNVSSGAASATNGVSNGNPVTISSIGGYVTIAFRNAYGINPVNYDTMIEYGSSASTYVPYTISNTVTLDSSKEFRGLYQLVSGELRADGDIYEADGNVTRKYGIVDLGSLSWNNASSYGWVQSPTIISNIKPSANNQRAKIISRKYQAESADTVYNRTYDNSIGINSSGVVQLYSSSFASMIGADVKTAMNGVYLVYELATPTTETATPYTNPQIIDADGTEEFVDYKVSQGTRDVAIPVGHESDFYDYTDGAITIPELPFSDGTYALSVTMNNGTPTFSWEGGN